jgi:hypothetical protein
MGACVRPFGGRPAGTAYARSTGVRIIRPERRLTSEGAREARDQRVRRADAHAERVRAKALWNIYRRHVTPDFADILQGLRELRLGIPSRKKK